MNTPTNQSENIESALNSFLAPLRNIARHNIELRRDILPSFVIKPIAATIGLIIILPFVCILGFIVDREGFIEGYESEYSELFNSGIIGFLQLLGMVAFAFLFICLFLGISALWKAWYNHESLSSRKHWPLRNEIAIVLQDRQSSMALKGQSLTNELRVWLTPHLASDDRESRDAAQMLLDFYSSSQYERFSSLGQDNNQTKYFAKGTKERWGAHFADFFLSLTGKVIALVVGLAILAFIARLIL